MTRLQLIFLGLLTLGGCSTWTGLWADLPPLPQIEATDYQLGPGDTVRLITYGEESLTGEFHVGDSGTIALPLIGVVPAANLTTGELQRRIAAALRQGDVLRNPSVSVEVVSYRPIFVLGEVNKPGQYPFQPRMTVVTAAAVAGGFTYRAMNSHAAVIRTVNGVAIEGKVPRQGFVQPGDVITIEERRF